MSILKTIQLYALKWWILWYVNYTSIFKILWFFFFKAMGQPPHQNQYLHCVIIQKFFLSKKNAIYIRTRQKMMQGNLQQIQGDNIFIIQRAHKQTDKQNTNRKNEQWTWNDNSYRKHRQILRIARNSQFHQYQGNAHYTKIPFSPINIIQIFKKWFQLFHVLVKGG